MPDSRSITLRFLSQETAIECGVTDMNACVETIADTFELHAHGRTLMGGDGSLTHGQILRWPENSSDPQMPSAGPDRRFAAMPAYVGGDVYKVGIKWYGSNINNPKEHGLPRSMHVITLNDPDTGKPVALLDGTLVSAMRTGAVAGVGAHQIAGNDAKTAAVIGTGVIGRTATMALDAALDNLESIEVYDLDLEKSAQFAEELTNELDVTVQNTETAKAAVSDADVVVVAAAGSSPPILEAEWLDSEATIIPLGNIDLPLSAIADDGVYVDDRSNIAEFVEYTDWQITEDIERTINEGRWSFEDFTELSSLIAENSTSPSSGRSLLLAYGLPIEDVAWAATVYERALESGAGQELTLFEEPYWA